MTQEEKTAHFVAQGYDEYSAGVKASKTWNLRNPLDPNLPRGPEGSEYTMNPYGNPVWTKKDTSSPTFTGSNVPTAPGAASVWDRWGKGPEAFEAETFDSSLYDRGRADREKSYQDYLSTIGQAKGLVSSGRMEDLDRVADYYTNRNRASEAAAMNTGFTSHGVEGSPDEQLAAMRKASSGYDQNLANILTQQARTSMEHGAGLSGLGVRQAEAGQQFGLAQQKFGLESSGQAIGRESTLAGLDQQRYATELSAWIAKMNAKRPPGHGGPRPLPGGGARPTIGGW